MQDAGGSEGHARPAAAAWFQVGRAVAALRQGRRGLSADRLLPVRDRQQRREVQASQGGSHHHPGTTANDGGIAMMGPQATDPATQLLSTISDSALFAQRAAELKALTQSAAAESDRLSKLTA